MDGFKCLRASIILILMLISALSMSLKGFAQAQLSPYSAESDTNAATPAVYLMTIAPGKVYWERFGHNAIIIDPNPGEASPFGISPQAIAYNFGYFDMSEAGFLPNFIQGRMNYEGVQIRALDDIANYQSQDRSISLQLLNLSRGQANKLTALLISQTTAPDERYRYDYFRQNCSTKLRDALNMAFDGGIEKSVQGRATGQTFRSLGLAHAQGELWLYLGIHAGLGPATDRPLSFYEEYFIPGQLMRGIADKSITGTPIVRSTQIIQPDMPSTPAQPDWRYQFGVIGLLIALGIAANARFSPNNASKARHVGSTFMLGFFAIAIGLFGALLFFLQLTNHSDAHWNLNLFLFNPLWFLAAPGAGKLFKAPVIRAGLNLALALALFGSGIKVFPWIRQQNIEWVLLMLPILYAVWFARRQASAIQI